MSIPTAPLEPSVYLYADNTPVANGYLLLSLYPAGGQENNNVQLQSNAIKVPLSSSGAIITNTFPIANYIAYVYSAQGQLVAGPIFATS